jgi:DNA repair protein RecN (Recombination protein N)
VRRVLSRTGRTKTYIQDRPVSLNVLQNMMNPYIGIQSQFAQLDLLDPRRQLNLLDARGGQAVTSLREKLQEKVSAALKKEREYAALVKRRQEIEERYEGAEEILTKIRSLHLAEDSEKRWEETLREMQQKISRSEKILAIYDELTGGCAGEGLRSRLEMIIYELKTLLDQEIKENLGELTETLANGLRSIEDLCEKHLESEDPQKLQESFTSLERRLGILRKLKRMTRSETASDLAEYERQATEELQWLKNSREKLLSLQEESGALRKEVTHLAMDLRKARKEAARSLEKAVNAVLCDLGMESFIFGVDMFPAEKVRYHGADEVDFFLSDGANLKDSVAKVASGGELSRLLLALQCASPREMLPPVLVFDEVEAGLGGKAAMLSGYKLRELSEDCQVILVTHEASIAALADQHFKVERTQDVTRVVEVSGEKRVVEIARMLAGDHEAPEALMHARSLVAATGK